MLKKYLNNKGFGLVELLFIVIIVISLSAVSFNYYKLSLEKSKVADAMMILRQIADANIVYFGENRFYTDDINELLVSIQGTKTDENGYHVVKTDLFSYRAGKPSSGEDEFKIASAKRGNKYEIYALYNNRAATFRFDAYGAESTDANFIDGKIVETIRAKGRL